MVNLVEWKIFLIWTVILTNKTAGQVRLIPGKLEINDISRLVVAIIIIRINPQHLKRWIDF